MPITSTHPEYDRFLPQWQKVRICCEGEEAVKAAGPVFLPHLSGQLPDEYAAYKQRAMFYGASARTVQGLTGAIFRKPPDVRFVRGKEDLLKTIGRAKESLEDVAKQVVEHCVGVGRVGILVDAPRIENGQPFIALYSAESVINWLSVEGPEGEETVEVVLAEEKYVRDPDDPFISKKTQRYRVLRLGDPKDESIHPEDVGSGIYFQDLYEEQTSLQDGEEVTEVVYLGRTVPRKLGGGYWKRIPFRVANSSKIGLKPEKSPILDLVNVNLSHYRNSADLEHGRHFTALPTAWVAGFDNKQQLIIGASRAWVTSDTSARAGFLEFTGAGLGHLQGGMEAKEKLMAVLGARMLEELPVGTEAAEAVRLRQSGEASALSGVAVTCSTALSQALADVAEWMNLPSKDVSVHLNRDFQTAGLAPNVLQNLILAVQGGLCSWQTFFWNLKRGELIPDQIDEKEELKLIKEGSPMFVLEEKPTTQTDKRVK